MRTKVYKSLDSPWSFLGLEGDYILYGIVACVIGLFAGAFTGGFFHRILGIFLGLIGAGIGYFITYTIQGKMTDRQLHKKMAASLRPKKTHMLPLDYSKQIIRIKRD